MSAQPFGARSREVWGAGQPSGLERWGTASPPRAPSSHEASGCRGPERTSLPLALPSSLARAHRARFPPRTRGAATTGRPPWPCPAERGKPGHAAPFLRRSVSCCGADSAGWRSGPDTPSWAALRLTRASPAWGALAKPATPGGPQSVCSCRWAVAHGGVGRGASLFGPAFAFTWRVNVFNRFRLGVRISYQGFRDELTH